MLKQLLEKLLCKHRWKDFEKREIWAKGRFDELSYIFTCQNCGKIKKIEM